MAREKMSMRKMAVEFGKLQMGEVIPVRGWLDASLQRTTAKPDYGDDYEQALATMKAFEGQSRPTDLGMLDSSLED